MTRTIVKFILVPIWLMLAFSFLWGLTVGRAPDFSHPFNLILFLTTLIGAATIQFSHDAAKLTAGICGVIVGAMMALQFQTMLDMLAGAAYSSFFFVLGPVELRGAAGLFAFCLFPLLLFPASLWLIVATAISHFTNPTSPTAGATFSENADWIVRAGGDVISKEARPDGPALTDWERLLYCLWVTDYMMRNAGDFANAPALYPDFQTDAALLAKKLALPKMREAFSLSPKKLQQQYFQRFEAICDELKNAQPPTEKSNTTSRVV